MIAAYVRKLDSRAVMTLGAVIAALTIGWVSPSAAQAPDAKLGRSGIRGRLVIAPELANAKVWPISQNRLDGARGAYRVRRPFGASPQITPTEPAPELMVVLEGVRGKTAPERNIAVEDQRFVPGQVLVPLPSKLMVENKQAVAITITSDEGEDLATIPPGEKREVRSKEGMHLIRVKEFSYATATVRVLPKAQVLPVGEKGLIPPTPLAGAEYRLAFYHGAEPLLVRPLNVPPDAYIAIDASISKNRVVTVSIKNGDLQVLVPRTPRRRPAPTPPPSPPPEDETDQ